MVSSPIGKTANPQAKTKQMSKTLLCYTVRKHQTDYRVERNLKGIFVFQQWVNQQVWKHLTAVCACMHACLYAPVSVCAHVSMYTHVSVRMSVCTCMCLCCKYYVCAYKPCNLTQYRIQKAQSCHGSLEGATIQWPPTPCPTVISGRLHLEASLIPTVLCNHT